MGPRNRVPDKRLPGMSKSKRAPKPYEAIQNELPGLRVETTHGVREMILPSEPSFEATADRSEPAPVSSLPPERPGLSTVAEATPPAIAAAPSEPEITSCAEGNLPSTSKHAVLVA